jgi:hypothetical protein
MPAIAETRAIGRIRVDPPAGRVATGPGKQVPVSAGLRGLGEFVADGVRVIAEMWPEVGQLTG